MNCIYCGKELTQEMINQGICFNCGDEVNASIEEADRIQKEQVEEDRKIRNSKREADLLNERFRENQLEQDFILSTTHMLEGYKILGYCGLAYGEVIYKIGLWDKLNASGDNLNAIMSFENKEFAGTGKMLKKAREYAMSKLIEEAKCKGGNAVIGIDNEVSYANSGMIHVTISGTVVRIEKIK